jgi:hypothetical protein
MPFVNFAVQLLPAFPACGIASRRAGFPASTGEAALSSFIIFVFEAACCSGWKSETAAINCSKHCRSRVNRWFTVDRSATYDTKLRPQRGERGTA